MTQNINDTLKAPSWQMDDAYGRIGSDRWNASVEKVKQLIATLKIGDAGAVQAMLTVYEEALTLHSSLACFAKCTGAKDSTDASVAPAEDMLAQLKSDLEAAAQPLFAAIELLKADDALWQQEPLAHWKFFADEKTTEWHHKLHPSDRAWLSVFEAKCFAPLGGIFKNLQKRVDFEAENSVGEKERIKAAKLVAVIKGAPDRVLRANVNKGLHEFYGKNGDLYASLLNELHGFRLAAFERAGVAPLEVSLHQNRMSEGALQAMRTAILNHIDEVRQCVTLRAPFFGGEKLAVYDLMAPAPVSGGKVPALIPYEDGIGMVKKALASVNPAIADFIDMMLANGWLEAEVSDKKIGGAFYSRFNEFKIPRVFSTYLGTITAILQQGHELGHAFHYWQMRDLPMIETEFPMTLTETASTFNEAVIRKYLFDHADEAEKFGMLWQEMRSGANFLMNTMVRMEFELAFLKEREKGTVSAKRCCELMDAAWRLWYGDTTEGSDSFLWAYKLHYYKTDQLIYNYPYTVGFLLSQALMVELKRRGADFYPFYIRMLRDTGRMTVDDVIRTHFEADASDPKFWENAMQGVLQSVRDFAAASKTQLNRSFS